MRRLMTAVAAIALMAGAAQAQGNGNGKGGGQGGGGHAAAQGGGGKGQGNASRGGGGGHAVGAPSQGGGHKDHGNAARGQGGGNDNVRVADNGNRDRGNAGNDRGGGGMQAVGAPREGGGSKDRGNVGRGNGNAGKDRGNDHRAVVIDDRGHGNPTAVVHHRGRDRDVDIVRVASFGAIPARGIVAGCPPGLAKKNPPCVPPGQVRSRFRGYDRPDFWGLRLTDGRYWYDDGYLVRLGPDGRIGGYVPLLGGALAIGNLWPTSYQPVALPVYYESYYGLGPYNAYRYADNVIYRVDPETAAITSIAALLTGDDFAVGQPMPVGYDIYNVPYPYRAQYYDRPDALYRYSDGYVYQVDPETRLIAAAIELLAS